MSIEWAKVFVPQVPILELVLRGTMMYLALFIVLRVVGRRRVGALGIPDLLMVVLIADAAQNGMARDYESVTEGLVLCLTIVGWSYLLDWVAFRFSAVQSWIESPPLALILHGRIQRRHLRQEMISEEELLSQLRQQGIEDVKLVKKAFMEPDGHISVIRIATAPVGPSTNAKVRKVAGTG